MQIQVENDWEYIFRKDYPAEGDRKREYSLALMYARRKGPYERREFMSVLKAHAEGQEKGFCSCGEKMVGGVCPKNEFDKIMKDYQFHAIDEKCALEKILRLCNSL